MPGNTWQIFSISGGVSPPDQSFSWHQARYLKNHLKYGEDEFYGDIDFFDRTIFGGLLTYSFSLYQEIPAHNYPDLNFDNDALYSIYRNIWWGLNSLYLPGLALLFSSLYGRKKAYLVLGFAATSPFIFLLNMGLWPKMLPVYFFCLFIFLNLKRKLPFLQ